MYFLNGKLIFFKTENHWPYLTWRPSLTLQYFFDAAEAEAWMSEQELYMMSEDRAKDEMGATNMLKKHSGLETTVDDYAETIRQLGERSRNLVDESHPNR